MLSLPPFEIIIPPEKWGKRSISTAYPENSKYKINIATPQFIRTKEATFSRQTFTGHDYSLELWSFSLSRGGHVYMRAHKPFIALLINLKGVFSISSDKDDITRGLEEKQYCLCYFSKGMYKISLQQTDNVLVIVAPPVYHLYSMALEHLIVQDLFNSLSFDKGELIFLKVVPLSHSVLRIIKLLERSAEKEASLDYTVRVYMLQLLSLYNKQLRIVEGEASRNAYIRNNKIERIVQYIRDHLSDDKLDDTRRIAHTFKMNLTIMRKEFKRVTGKTIQNFIRDERLHYSKKLLEESELPIFEVAAIICYSSTSNFSRAYKKMFGHAPANEV